MNAGFRFLECEQGTEQWLAARAGLITASCFADAISTVGGLDERQAQYVALVRGGADEKAASAMAGYKAVPSSDTIKRALRGEVMETPSDTALRYAADLAIERVSGKPFGIPAKTWLLERGHELERQARMTYEAKHASFVTEAGLCVMNDAPFGYSTDGLVDEDGLIEIKCPIAGDKILAMWRHGDVSEYIHQMQGGMWLTGRKWCDFIMYCPDLAPKGKDLFVKRILRDEDFISDMVEKLARFDLLVQADFRFLSDATAPVNAEPVVSPMPRAGSRLAAILAPEQA